MCSVKVKSIVTVTLTAYIFTVWIIERKSEFGTKIKGYYIYFTKGLSEVILLAVNFVFKITDILFCVVFNQTMFFLTSLQQNTSKWTWNRRQSSQFTKSLTMWKVTTILSQTISIETWSCQIPWATVQNSEYLDIWKKRSQQTEWRLLRLLSVELGDWRYRLC